MLRRFYCILCAPPSCLRTSFLHLTLPTHSNPRGRLLLLPQVCVKQYNLDYEALVSEYSKEFVDVGTVPSPADFVKFLQLVSRPIPTVRDIHERGTSMREGHP